MLETAEVVSSATAVSSKTATLTVGSASANAGTVTKDDGVVVAIGKGIEFTVTTIAEDTATVFVDISLVGDQGTKDTYRVRVPVRPEILR